MSVSTTAGRPLAARHDDTRAVAAWLFSCCALIFLMVVVGGITRLTLSGLSITEWEPVTGIVPPLSQAQWLAEFARYKEIPEYRLIHYGMTLAQFKGIYFWEYAHRLLGRLIGVAFAVPLLWFWLRGRLPRHLAPALAGILALGFAQGFLGWYMVESGLAHRVEVSQYRLVAHLALALAIYSAILWTALGLVRDGAVARHARRPAAPAAFRPSISGERPHPSLPRGHGVIREGERSKIGQELQGKLGEGVFWRRAGEALLVLVALTIAAGGFTAGTRAGFVYNTFPLMDGRWLPAGYDQLQPLWRNWFENVAAVQFDHRLLAMTTAAAVLLLWLAARRTTLPRPARLALHLLLGVAALQVALGISTLLLVVPAPLAAAHQAGAVLLLSAAMLFRHTLRAIGSPMV